jgi:hypothetical protein
MYQPKDIIPIFLNKVDFLEWDLKTMTDILCLFPLSLSGTYSNLISDIPVDHKQPCYMEPWKQQ